MEEIKLILNNTYIGNSLINYLLFAFAIISGLVFKGLISKYLSHVIYRILGKRGDEVGIEKFDKLLTKPIALFIMLSILYIGAVQLQYPESWNLSENNPWGIKLIIKKLFSLVYIYSIIRIALKIVEYIGLILKKKAEKSENKMDDQLVPFGMEILKFIIYVFATFIILGEVFNVNVTALITGLGIGGIALAMASKESLENLLGSFTIFLDKPFTVGDLVSVGSITGRVEKVGFRSTRLRTFDRSLITVPNKKMIDAELDNLGLRPIRRVKFSVGLTYETSVDQIKKISNEIQSMIDQHPQTTSPDGNLSKDEEARVRFTEFGDSSLNILIIYYVNSPKWDDLIDVRQDINYKIMEIVKNNKSDFAFPSTTVYLQK